MQNNDEVGVAIDMGGTNIKIGLVLNGTILSSAKIEVLPDVNFTSVLAEIANAVDSLLNKIKLKPLGIGIAFPGIVDMENGIILSKYVKYPEAHATDLSSWASQRWGAPLSIENDARAALLGEWQYGAGKNSNDLVQVTLGTGFGTAVMMDGKVLRGRNHLAGNLGGHMTINLNGDVCNCGNIGCLESESSTWALQHHLKKKPEFQTSALRLEKELSFNSIFKHAQQGDALAMEIQNHCLKAWALGVISLIHAYDPEVVVIGGGVMRSKNIILPYIRKMVMAHSWGKNTDIKILAAEQVEFAGILGMYHLMTQKKTSNAPGIV